MTETDITGKESIIMIIVVIIYGVIGLLLTTVNDRYLLYHFYDDINNIKSQVGKKSLLKHFYEFIIIIATLGIIDYFGRNLIRYYLPLLLELIGIDFKISSIVHELKSGALLFFILHSCSEILMNKIKIIKEQLISSNYSEFSGNYPIDTLSNYNKQK
jgi:hypothetical protein